uniref:Uncharacterized protein n=1 Tax=Cannabis sativa TaxID=3483 RepID=A0A803P6R1_CANSA
MALSSTPDEITASMALLRLSSHSPPSSTSSPSTFSFEKRNEATNQNKNSPKLKESEKAAPKMIGENNPGLISMEDRLMAERLCKLKSMVSEE